MTTDDYGVATMSRLLKIIGLFCKRDLIKGRYSAKETYNLKEPTNRSHPIGTMTTDYVQWQQSLYSMYKYWLLRSISTKRSKESSQLNWQIKHHHSADFWEDLYCNRKSPQCWFDYSATENHRSADLSIGRQKITISLTFEKDLQVQRLSKSAHDNFSSSRLIRRLKMTVVLTFEALLQNDDDHRHFCRHCTYGVATISRLLKIIGLFCRMSSLYKVSFAKETYTFQEPTLENLSRDSQE